MDRNECIATKNFLATYFRSTHTGRHSATRRHFLVFGNKYNCSWYNIFLKFQALERLNLSGSPDFFLLGQFYVLSKTEKSRRACGMGFIGWSLKGYTAFLNRYLVKLLPSKRKEGSVKLEWGLRLTTMSKYTVLNGPLNFDSVAIFVS